MEESLVKGKLIRIALMLGLLAGVGVTTSTEAAYRLW